MTDLILVIAAKFIIEKRTNIFLTIGSVDYFDGWVVFRLLPDPLSTDFPKLNISVIARLGLGY